MQNLQYWVRLARTIAVALGLVVLGLLLAFAPNARAHDVPDEVRVQAFVKPEGQALRLVMRVPLKAMRDVDVPQRRGGFLDFSRVDAALRDAATLWLGNEIELYEGDERLPRPRLIAARVSLESDRSFAAYESALAHFEAPPLGNDTELYWSQGLLDVLLEYPIRSDRSQFSIRPQLERLGIKVNVVLRFLPPSGFVHILGGTDHLLFLLCLVVPFRRFWPLAAIVTAFTVAHSITLIATALGHGPDALWFPPLIEVLIAASIFYMALENVLGARLRRRWMVAFGFGLVHGFGFAFGLQQLLQFAGAHLVTSLLAFNVGVELGQLAVLVVAIPALDLAFRHVPERVATIVLSLLVGHTAWHWLWERWERLSKFPWPAADPEALAGVVRWLIVLVLLSGLAWLVFEAIRRRKLGASEAKD
jgi:hypothetical protein